jgi:hypothetical protein
MSKEEKIHFIEEILEGLKEKAIKNVDKMPEEWDGWELRQYLADKAGEFVWESMKQDRGRKRKYNNIIRTTDL